MITATTTDTAIVTATPDADDDVVAPPSGGRWRWVLFPLAVFVASRTLIVVFVTVTLRAWPRLATGPAVATGWPWVDGLGRWDACWFARLADTGYEYWFDPNFFPLLPVLARGLAWATGLPPLAAVVVVANVAGLAALLAVYRVFRAAGDDRTARAAVLLWAAWPFSFFHAAGYPETLMVASTAGAVLLAGRGRHVAAGAAMGAGVLARHLTALVWASLLWHALCAPRRRPGKRPAWGAAAAGAAAAALVVAPYFAFCWARFGNPLQWAVARGYWGEDAAWGLWAIPLIDRARQPQLLAYAALSVVPAAGAYLLRRRRAWHGLFPFAAALIGLAYAVGLSGLGRYTASCWPAFLPLGAAVAGRPRLKWAAVGLLAAGQAAALFLYSHGYDIT